MKKVLLIGISCCCMFMTFATQKHKIWVLGDSTLCNFKSSDATHRVGWAQVLQSYLITDSAEVHNRAISGRSSKSFFTDPDGWPAFKDSIGAGDYVLIEFGHNDEKITDTARGTTPDSFKYYLSAYIDAAKAKGAIPILGTPIERNNWSADTVKYSHVVTTNVNGQSVTYDYPKAVKELAVAKDVAIVDMTLLTTQLYVKLGKDSTTKLFASGDKTHIIEAGAYAISKLFVDNVIAQKLSPIYKLFKGATNIDQIASRSVKDQKNNRIQYTGNGNVKVISNEKVMKYSIIALNGQVINANGITSSDNNLKLTTVTGAILPSGNYLIDYSFHNSVSNIGLISVK